MATLDEGARLLPNAVWWLKADGVDVLPGLGESEWSGDVDLGDGRVQCIHETPEVCEANWAYVQYGAIKRRFDAL